MLGSVMLGSCLRNVEDMNDGDDTGCRYCLPELARVVYWQSYPGSIQSFNYSHGKSGVTLRRVVALPQRKEEETLRRAISTQAIQGG